MYVCSLKIAIYSSSIRNHHSEPISPWVFFNLISMQTHPSGSTAISATITRTHTHARCVWQSLSVAFLIRNFYLSPLSTQCMLYHNNFPFPSIQHHTNGVLILFYFIFFSLSTCHFASRHVSLCMCARVSLWEQVSE